VKLNVHFLRDVDSDYISRFESNLHSDINLTCGEKLPENREIDILIAGVPERKHIIACPGLKALVIPWSGLPNATRELMREFPEIAVHNIHHNAAPTAETAISLLMAAAKNLIPVDRSFRKNDWSLRYSENRSILLEGKTALILGFGSIGKKIASICQGLGMTVLAIKRNISEKNRDDPPLFDPENLYDLLPKANILFITLPLTPRTKDLIGAGELALLKDNAIIINVARGPIINESALFNELKSGRLKAGLDVWYNYPKKENERNNTPPSDFPFSDLENVVMTPHLGGNSDMTEDLRIEKLAELLNSAAKGKEIPGRVDLERGY